MCLICFAWLVEKSKGPPKKNAKKRGATSGEVEWKIRRSLQTWIGLSAVCPKPPSQSTHLRPKLAGTASDMREARAAVCLADFLVAPKSSSFKDTFDLDSMRISLGTLSSPTTSQHNRVKIGDHLKGLFPFGLPFKSPKKGSYELLVHFSPTRTCPTSEETPRKKKDPDEEKADVLASWIIFSGAFKHAGRVQGTEEPQKKQWCPSVFIQQGSGCMKNT